ncbi:hypothetical protein L2E82_36090 [Cichorium intybus]|uniref:Uncharacterized protein n=1 Tax=Cichorium intybus TaxID=13427 RepID=A0ACB9BQK5_CICIN|nr:hypothetical protein L2E82_36090 [Cichorium intybus]
MTILIAQHHFLYLYAIGEWRKEKEENAAALIFKEVIERDNKEGTWCRALVWVVVLCGGVAARSGGWGRVRRKREREEREWFRFDYKTLIAFLGGYCAMIATLLQFMESMLPDEPSPMETHGPFMIILTGAFGMTISASGILFYTMNDLLSPTYEMILYGFFWISMILSCLSFGIVILIPKQLEWVGYTILFVFFVVIVWLYLKGLPRLPEKKYEDNTEALEMV